MPYIGKQGVRCPRCDSIVYAVMFEVTRYPLRAIGRSGRIEYPADVSKTHREMESIDLDHIECLGCDATWKGTAALYEEMLEKGGVDGSLRCRGICD